MSRLYSGSQRTSCGHPSHPRRQTETGITALRPWWTACTAGLLLASCVTGPDYRRPEVSAPDAYKTPEIPGAESAKVQRDWWRAFGNADLDALIATALAANQDLKAAAARVAQARATVGSTRSSLFPRVSTGASASRSRSAGVDEASASAADRINSATSVINQVAGLLGQVNALAAGDYAGAMAGGGQAGAASAGQVSVDAMVDRYQFPIDLSYEIDVWGRIRRSIESAEAQARASEYDLEVVRQTLLTDLARDYFGLRSLDAQHEILERNLALFGEQAALTRLRYEAGLADETDALQAEVQLESTRAQLADTRRQRANMEHAIAVLTGRAPAEFAVDPCPLSATPPAVPVGVPSDLLRQRPDVAGAEQSLMAACAEIGVAEAQRFPSVTITGSAGLQGDGSGGLLDWANRYWSIGPSLSLPFSEGGRLRAEVEAARARYSEAEALYHESVLAAFRDVEDALTDLRYRGEQADAQSRAVASARDYRRLAHIQYDAGTLDYLYVVNAEQSLLSNELSEVQTMEQRMVSTVLLIKAIGGGWAVPDEAHRRPTAGGQAVLPGPDDRQN